MAVDIVRAWKDPEYRKTLTPEELASLPENPAGKPELTADDLANVVGGAAVIGERSSEPEGTYVCCTGPSSCPDTIPKTIDSVPTCRVFP
jgi:mersacidin/lichenicidin family type 2 lantibiotic